MFVDIDILSQFFSFILLATVVAGIWCAPELRVREVASSQCFALRLKQEHIMSEKVYIEINE